MDSRESINTRVLTYKDGSQVLLYRNYSPGREIIRDTMVFANGDKYPIRTQLYNEKGKLLCKKDLQNSLEYEYDSVGRKIMSLSNGVKTEYKYDEKGNTILIKSDTTTTEMEYDSLNRLVAKTINGVRKEYIKQTPKQEIVDSKSTKQEVVVQKSEMAETKTATQPVKPLSPKDSAFAAKEIELRQQYGEVVRHETVFEIKDNQVKYYRYYRYVDASHQLFLERVRTIEKKHLPDHKRTITIDTVYDWRDSIDKVNKEIVFNFFGPDLVYLRFFESKIRIDTSLQSFINGHSYYNFTRYEKDSVSEQWVLAIKEIKFNDTVTYEYKKNDEDAYLWDRRHKMSTLYRHIVDSLDNSYLDVKFCKKENEPDSCWKLRDISGFVYDTVERAYIEIKNFSFEENTIDIQWFDKNKKPKTGTIGCKLLPNGVITPVGYSVDTQLKPRNFSTHINYEWNSEDSSFHVADSVMMYQGRVVESKEEYKRLLDYELNTPTYTLEELKAYVRYNAIVFIKTKKKTFSTQPAESWIRKYEADGFKTLKDW